MWASDLVHFDSDYRPVHSVDGMWVSRGHHFPVETDSGADETADAVEGLAS